MLSSSGHEQVVIQLRKFADTVKKVRAAVSPTAASAVPPPAKAGIRVGLLEQDVSSALRTDITGIDASALGESPVPLPNAYLSEKADGRAARLEPLRCSCPGKVYAKTDCFSTLSGCCFHSTPRSKALIWDLPTHSCVRTAVCLAA